MIAGVGQEYGPLLLSLDHHARGWRPSCCPASSRPSHETVGQAAFFFTTLSIFRQSLLAHLVSSLYAQSFPFRSSCISGAAGYTPKRFPAAKSSATSSMRRKSRDSSARHGIDPASRARRRWPRPETCGWSVTVITPSSKSRSMYAASAVQFAYSSAGFPRPCMMAWGSRTYSK